MPNYLEIEVKFLEVNVPKMRKKLLELGFKHFPRELEVYQYFDFPDKSVSKKGLLRIRKEHGKAMLVFKTRKKFSTAKEMFETEVEVSDFEKTVQILEALGLECVSDCEKKRESFQKGKFSVEIDTLPGIPAFLEIEGPNISEIAKLVQKLGLEMNDGKNWGGGQVLKHYGIDIETKRVLKF